MVSEKSKGPKWDGKSRVSNDSYRKNYNKIFQKKDFLEEAEREKKELAECYEEGKRQCEERKAKE